MGRDTCAVPWTLQGIGLASSRQKRLLGVKGPDIPQVIEDESTQSDVEVMDSEDGMTSDGRIEQSVEGPEPSDLLPESPRSQT